MNGKRQGVIAIELTFVRLDGPELDHDEIVTMVEDHLLGAVDVDDSIYEIIAVSELARRR